MDNLEHAPSQGSSSAEVNVLQAQVEALSSLVVSVLILLVVLAATFDLYLMRQIKDTRAELPNLRNYVMQLQRQSMAIDAFAGKLAEYGRTHADFSPIMTKYGLKPAAAAAMPAPATSLPAPPPSTKK